LANTSEEGGVVTDAAEGQRRPVSRLERRKRRTRAALISAAQAFIAEGKLNVPVLEITQAADVGMGSFYNHFDSREQLFQAAIGEVFDAHGGRLDRLPEVDDPAETFARSFRLTGRLFRKRPQEARVLLNSGVGSLFSERGLGLRALRDIKAANQAGRFHVADPELALAMAAGATLGLGQLLQEQRERDAAAASDQFAQDLLRIYGVASQGGAENLPPTASRPRRSQRGRFRGITTNYQLARPKRGYESTATCLDRAVVLSLCISVLALLVSVGVLVWRVTSWRRSGPRVSVETTEATAILPSNNAGLIGVKAKNWVLWNRDKPVRLWAARWVASAGLLGFLWTAEGLTGQSRARASASVEYARETIRQNFAAGTPLGARRRGPRGNPSRRQRPGDPRPTNCFPTYCRSQRPRRYARQLTVARAAAVPPVRGVISLERGSPDSGHVSGLVLVAGR
jgi:AcrR family transcriptional regulator